MKKLLEYINKIQPEAKTLHSYQDGFFDALEVIKDYIKRDLDSIPMDAPVKPAFGEIGNPMDKDDMIFWLQKHFIHLDDNVTIKMRALELKQIYVFLTDSQKSV